MAGSSGDTQLPLRPVPDPLARSSRLFDRRHSPLFGLVVLLSPIQTPHCPLRFFGSNRPFLYRKTIPPPHLLQHHRATSPG
jgi:hypothetical protein